MSLYLTSEKDTINFIPATIFWDYVSPWPQPPFEEKYLPNVLKGFKNHYTYHCIVFKL